jgi:membrane protein implicated in regulation of membrane protease activity
VDQFAAFYLAHTFWFWLSLGVFLLAIEAALGTEWLLWLAVAAGLVALLALLPVELSTPVEVGVFAAATLVLTLSSRFLTRRTPETGDINDNRRRVIGDVGSVVIDFQRGAGRVQVGGAEWPAEGDSDYPAGTRVVVEAVIGNRLRVRPA